MNSQHCAWCDKLLLATQCTCPGENIYSFPHLHFDLLALHALLNGTDGSTVPITHHIAWLISVVLQVQRCQAGAAGLPWLPVRPLILWLVSSLPSGPHLILSAARKMLFATFFHFCLFWSGVSSHYRQSLIAVGRWNNFSGISDLSRV